MYLNWYDIAVLPCMWYVVGITYLILRAMGLTAPTTYALGMLGACVLVLLAYLLIVIIDNK